MKNFSGRTLFGILASLCIAACSEKVEKNFLGTDITGIEISTDAKLIDHNGNSVGSDFFEGKVTVLFFGFTSCPDICPTTLVKFDSALKKIPVEKDSVRVVFLSVDPERDTADVLKKYVTSFNSKFIGVTGSAVDIKNFTKSYKVFHKKVYVGDSDSYTIDHFAGAYLLDRNGKPRVLLSHSQSDSDVAKDISTLLQE